MPQETYNTLVGVVLVLLLVVIVVGILFYGIWAYLHKTMAKSLDKELFREPHFQPKELLNYRFFPLSLVKSLNYIFLIAIPRLAIHRRFKTLTGPPKVPKSTRVLCKLVVTLQFMGLFIGVMMFSLMFYLLSTIDGFSFSELLWR